MSQVCRRFNFKPSLSLAFCLVFVTLSLLSGCYEGSKKPRHDDEPGNGPGPGKGGGEKIFGIAILDIIRPSGDALTDLRCAAIPKSLVELRAWELEERAKSIQAVLTASAETVRVVTTEIVPADCQSMIPLKTRSESVLPDISPTSTQKLKPAVHVRLVMWFNDQVYLFPSGNIPQKDWADGQYLKQMGVSQVLGVSHFALTKSNYGYFNWWREFSLAGSYHDAKVIENPAPTQAGVQDETTAIQTSAAEFAQWLSQQVGQK